MNPTPKSTSSSETRTTAIGHVAAIWRYPVKSMAAESLKEVQVSWHGLDGDRRWAFVRGSVERSGFPWLTIRQLPEMGRYTPWFVEPGKPNTSATMIRTPSGAEVEVTDSGLANELGHGARVIKQDRGVFDTFPLSFITTQTVAELEATVGAKLDVQRFRPNLLIADTSNAAFPEDAWVGRTLRIGDAVVRVDKRDQRCAVVNVDPLSSKLDPSLLRTIASKRDGCLGVYGSTVKPGSVSVGDLVSFDE